MGNAKSLSAFFTDEWERFNKGLAQLDPDAWNQLEASRGRIAADPNSEKQINVPGFDDIVHLTPRYQPTGQERDEYYAARRTGRAPNISTQAARAIESNRAMVERIRNSAAAPWARGWGSIMTAIDNVQDFGSTLSTFGRLALLGAGKWGPFSQALALEKQLAELAGEKTSAIARRRAMIYIGRAALPTAARVGARMVPLLGWVILASDLLNLLTLVGMLATPLYGAICTGNPLQAGAGIPSMFLRQGLKSEIWTAARRNPIGKAARQASALKAVGRWPSVYNLMEVLQTTDQLFGVGLSFGAVVGMLNEIGGAGVRALEGKGTTVNVTDAANSWTRLLQNTFDKMSTGERWLWAKSNAVMATASGVMSTQDQFTTQEHLEVMAAYTAAAAHVFSILEPLPWERVLEPLRDMPITPVVATGKLTDAWAEYTGLQIPDPGPFVLPGSPHVLTLDQYISQTAPLHTTALHDFLRPRRNDAVAVGYGAMASTTIENFAHFITGQDDGFRYRMQTDLALVAGLAERGYLLNVGDPLDRLWAMWLDAREIAVTRSPHPLELADWHRLAARYSLRLIRQLPPDAPFPGVWSEVPL